MYKIYVATQQSLTKNFPNATKIGYTSNWINRSSSYKTNFPLYNIKPHIFIKCNTLEEVKQLELDIHTSLELYNFINKEENIDGGCEWFDLKVDKEILQPILDECGYNNEIVDDQEIIDKYIDESRKEYLKEKCAHKIKIEENKRRKDRYRPSTHECVEDCIKYFLSQEKGILNLPCGYGKTTITNLFIKKMNYEKILIGVPTIKLLEQWYEKLLEFFPHKIIRVGGGNKIPDKVPDKVIILTTYSSSNKVRELNIEYDIKVYDECHHLGGNNTIIPGDDMRVYKQILRIPGKKTLSLTATLKGDMDNNMGNYNVEDFGNVIVEKSLLEAIRDVIVADYKLEIIVSGDDENFGNLEKDKDKQLFLSTKMTLQSIYNGTTHHNVMFCNGIENSNKILNFLKVLNSGKEIYYNTYNSNNNDESIIENFKKSPNGILICVYSLGEGWDLPLLDGITFCENMTSFIRIVQIALRCCRLDKNNPNKKGDILIPIYDTDEWGDENGNFNNVIEIIERLSMFDENIFDKIKINNIKEKETKEKETKEKETEEKETDNFEIETIRKIKTKLINRNCIGIIKYEKLKCILKFNNIKTQSEYLIFASKNIRYPDDPEKTCKGWKGWLDFLNININDYYDIEYGKQIIFDYNVDGKFDYTYIDNNNNMKQIYELDKKFPHPELWEHMYGVEDMFELLILDF